MQGDKFTVNDKEYTIVRNLKFMEVTQIQKIFSNSLNAQKQIGDPVAFSKLSTDEQMKIIMPTFENTNEQNEKIVQFLSSVLGLSQDAINDLDFEEAFAVFNQGYIISTTIKKKLEEPSGLPLSSETQN